MIALTGGSGFIGRALLRRLRADGLAVRVLDRWRADLAAPDGFAAALEGCATLVHLASTSVPGDAGADPAADARLNVAGGVALFEAAQAAGVRRVLFPSSAGAVYGRATTTPTPEEHPLRPLGAYGAAKAALEAYLSALAERGVGATVLRLSNVYGPGQSPRRGQGAVAAFGARLLRGEPIELWGDGSAVRDYLYVDDAVDALRRALDWEGRGLDVLNVGSGEGLTTLELLRRLERVAGVRAQVRHLPARAYDVPVSTPDSARIRARGWSPRTPLDAGLARTLEALREG